MQPMNYSGPLQGRVGALLVTVNQRPGRPFTFTHSQAPSGQVNEHFSKLGWTLAVPRVVGSLLSCLRSTALSLLWGWTLGMALFAIENDPRVLLREPEVLPTARSPAGSPLCIAALRGGRCCVQVAGASV